MKFVVLALLVSVAFVAAEEDPNKGETFLSSVPGGNGAAGETLLKPSANQNPTSGPCACGFTAPNVCNPCGQAVTTPAPTTPSTNAAGQLVSSTGKTLKPVKVESSRQSGPCCCSCNNCNGCVVATTCGCQPEFVAPEIREVPTCGCSGQPTCGCDRQVVNACGCCGQATCGCCSPTMVKPELKEAHVQPELKERCPCYYTRVEPCPCAASFREVFPANTAVVDGVKL